MPVIKQAKGILMAQCGWPKDQVSVVARTGPGWPVFAANIGPAGW
jgi:hypothetical protein